MSLQPISPAFWMFETPPVLTPLRGFGQGGQADLTIEARQPGVGFGDTGCGLRACVRQDEAYELARTEPQGSKKPGEIRGWRTAGIVDTKPREAGAATVRLSLPSDILPAWGWMVPIHIAVVSLDGQYMAQRADRDARDRVAVRVARQATPKGPRAGSGSTGSGGTGSGRHLAQPLLEYFLGMDRRPFHRTRQGPEPLPFPDLLLDGDHCLGARLCVCRHGQPLEHDPEHDVAARDRRHRLRHSAVDLVGHVRGLDVAAARRKHRDRGRPRRREAEAAGVLAAP